MSRKLPRLQKTLLTISLLLLVAACVQPKLTANTVIVHDPFPVMTSKQVGVMDSCLVMNSRNPDVDVASKAEAKLVCNKDFWLMDEWWIRFVKAWKSFKN